MTDWSKLLSQAEVPNVLRDKKKAYIEKTIWRKVLEDEEGEGWKFLKDTKNPEKIKK